MTEEELEFKERELRLKGVELELMAKKHELMRLEDERRRLNDQRWHKERKEFSDQKLSAYVRLGCFLYGVGVVGAGFADALFNSFAFIDAPKLIVAGIALMVVAAIGRRRDAND